ncbi:MAG TPA: hypothetical protein VFJ90_12835, partial [Candidatus Didemnitutus sp.]|nr:hypothetical protein [Candidatus Didemnitutus sp.]
DLPRPRQGAHHRAPDEVFGLSVIIQAEPDGRLDRASYSVILSEAKDPLASGRESENRTGWILRFAQDDNRGSGRAASWFQAFLL